MSDNGSKTFHDGRLSDFRPAQAAASVTAPWDPRPEIRGDVYRRLNNETAQISRKMQAQKSWVSAPFRAIKTTRAAEILS
jgi:hypothetical protein